MPPGASSIAPLRSRSICSVCREGPDDGVQFAHSSGFLRVVAFPVQGVSTKTRSKPGRGGRGRPLPSCWVVTRLVTPALWAFETSMFPRPGLDSFASTTPSSAIASAKHHALVCDRLGQLSRLGAGRGAHVEDVHPGTAVEEFHRDHRHRLLLGDAAGGV